MLAIERKQKILSILKEDKKVLVSDLSKVLGVSDETIRKDLKELEISGIVIRSHGGAILKNANFQPSFSERETINFDAKAQIALLSQKYIEDGMTVMVDTSTTSQFVMQNVSPKCKLTIITNSFNLINECVMNENFRFIATGGEVLGNLRAYVGRDCLKVLDGYYVDLAILGTAAISINNGLMETNANEADVKIKMAQQSKKTLLVADHTKFDVTAPICTFGLNDIDYLVTDKRPREAWLSLLDNHGVDVTYKV